MLNRRDYLEAVKLTQIVSIDLLIHDSKGRILLGKRVNSPAKGTYFVPGGRVFKGETLSEGFKRLLKVETGITDMTKLRWSFNCVTDHIYPDNFADALDEKEEPIPMHFVCVGVNVFLDPVVQLDSETLKIQHENMLWLPPKELLLREDVHQYTKRYFVESDKKLC